MDKVRLLTLVVFVCLVVPVLSGAIYLDQLQDQTLAYHTRITTQQVSARLQEQVSLRLELMDTLVHEVESGALHSGAPFTARAGHLQRQVGGYQAINLVSPEGTIQQVVPPEANRDALGRDVSRHPIAGEAFRAAQREGTPALTPSLTLFQGGRGFASYFPIARGRRGFVNGVFRYEPMLSSVINPELSRNFATQVTVDSAPVFTASEPADAAPSMSTGFALRGHTWRLRLQPTEALYEHYHPWPGYLFPWLWVLAALALSVLVHRELRRYQREKVHKAQQERSRRLEALGTLAGGIAHDFNNLLTIFNATLELNLAEIEPDTLLHEDLTLLLDSARRAAGLTSQLLVFSKNQIKEGEAFALHEILPSTVALLHRLLPENIELRTGCQADTAWIKGEAGALQQVLVNLATNARDAMPRGGVLALGCQVDGRRARLWVKDNGQGMDASTQERIFDPFFTTKNPGKGTGLGMAMVYRTVVNQLGGDIQVQSQPGQGTTITLELPCQPQAAHSRGEATEARALSTSGASILLVEDNEAIRQTLTRFLRQSGYQVLAAANGRDALRSLDEPVDLLLTDVIMPQMGGQELAQRYLHKNPGGAVVFCTGYSDRALEVPQDALTATLSKPVELSHLRGCIESILQRRAGSVVHH